MIGKSIVLFGIQKLNQNSHNIRSSYYPITLSNSSKK